MRPSPFSHFTSISGLVLSATVWLAMSAPAVEPLDILSLGVPESEHAHALVAEDSDTLIGGLGLPARRFLPRAPGDFEGGHAAFAMKVDPDKPSYLTIRLWGSDAGPDRLLLLCEGKQIGYRHLGDVDLLDSPNDSPGYAGRFFYATTPLPVEMTRGKTELHFEIVSNGAVWGYGTRFEQYQKPMSVPTRGVYRVYTHVDPCFIPPADEKQGDAPVNPTVRQEPGPAVLDQVRARVSREVNNLLGGKSLNQHQLWFLARASHVKWTTAYHNEELAKKAVDALDQLFVEFRQNPDLVHSEKSIYNSDWTGLGPAACAAVLLADVLQPFLDAPVGGAGDVTRRIGWSEMFLAARDYHRENRRWYTNQTMISDLYGLYWPNRALTMLESPKALPEKDARHYLYESAGLQPWLGSERDGVSRKSLGEHYLQLTDKALTKELGFVGYYGEVLDWMTAMYEATRPAVDQPGDEKLKAQLVKAARARAVFRYPEIDDEGYRAMRAETIVGWRDEGHYPGDVMYAQRPTWDSSSLGAAAATGDPVLVGYVQQMFADNQFFSTLQTQLRVGGLRTTAALLDVPDDYEALKALPPCSSRLPMTAGQSDFVFADEEDGVLALKHGQDIFYASLYWRARPAVNFLARVHWIEPRFDRYGVVYEDVQFTPSGQTYVRRDWVNMGFGNGGIRYPGNVHSAHAGETLPIARVPADIPFKPGDENAYAGKGDFYKLKYGPYLIGMNTTKDQIFELTIPKVAGAVKDLVSGREDVVAGSTHQVGPRSTAVFYLEAESNPPEAAVGK